MDPFVIGSNVSLQSLCPSYRSELNGPCVGCTVGLPGAGPNNTTEIVPLDCSDCRLFGNTLCAQTAALSGFGVNLAITVGIALLIYIIFSILQKYHVVVYSPRCDDEGVERPLGLFGWIAATLKTEESDLRRRRGLDALVYLRFLKCCTEILCVYAIYSLAVLLPVNATGEYTKVSNYDAKYRFGLARTDASTIENGSPRLVAHFFAIWIVTGVSIWRVFVHMKWFAKERADYVCKDNRMENYAVLVRDLDDTIQTDSDLFNVADRICPDKIASAHLVYKTGVFRNREEDKDEVYPMPELYDDKTPEEKQKSKPKKPKQADLDKLWKMLGKTVKSLEKARVKLEKDPNAKLETKVDKKLLLFGGRKVDTLKYFTNRQIELRREIEQILSCPKPQKLKPCKTGFIVCKDQVSAYMFARSNFYSNPFVGETDRAPEPRDVNWDGVAMSSTRRLLATVFVYIFVLFLVIFWSVPVAFFTSFSNLETLSRLPFLASMIAWLQKVSPFLVGFIESFLPSLVITLFFIFLVPILKALSFQQGPAAKSIMDRMVFSKYFLFTVVNIFISGTLGPFLLNTMTALLTVQGPPPTIEEIFVLVGAALPTASMFFTNLIIFMTFVSNPMKLLRIGKPIVLWIKLKFLAKTPREIALAKRQGGFNFGMGMAKDLLTFQLAVAFCMMSSLVVPFAAVYFFLNFLSCKYNLTFVMRQPYSAGGLMLPSAFNRIFMSILIMNITGIIFLATKTAPVMSGLTAIPLIATIAFWVGLNKRYMHTAIRGSLVFLDSGLSLTSQASTSGPAADDLRRGVYTKAVDELPSTQTREFVQPGFVPEHERLLYRFLPYPIEGGEQV